METDAPIAHADLEQSRLDAERDLAALYLNLPPGHRWFPFAAGLWAAALCITFAIDETWRSFAIFGLVALELAYLIWQRNARGMLRVRSAPTEIRSVCRWYYVGVIVVVVLTSSTLFFAGPWVAAAVALVVVTGALIGYRRAFRGAVERTRARLNS